MSLEAQLISLEAQLKRLNENLEKIENFPVIRQTQEEPVKPKQKSKPKKAEIQTLERVVEPDPGIDSREELSSKVVETARKKGRDVALGILAKFDAKKQSDVRDADVVRCLASLNMALAAK